MLDFISTRVEVLAINISRSCSSGVCLDVGPEVGSCPMLRAPLYFQRRKQHHNHQMKSQRVSYSISNFINIGCHWSWLTLPLLLPYPGHVRLLDCGAAYEPTTHRYRACWSALLIFHTSNSLLVA